MMIATAKPEFEWKAAALKEANEEVARRIQRAKEDLPPGKPGRRPKAGLFPAEPTATELKLVKEMAEAQSGSLEELAEVVDRVDSISSEVGGFERLKQCIAFWKEVEAPS
jgi:hypothetical protein